MKVEGLGEFGLLERIRPFLAAQSGKDDAAVLEDANGFIVASCDMFVEGVHFDLGWMSAEDAGWRSMALALGDLAAKGAAPSWALTSIALPRTWEVDDLDGLYRGMNALAESVGMGIVGGDMSSIDGPAVLHWLGAKLAPAGQWRSPVPSEELPSPFASAARFDCNRCSSKAAS